MYRSPILLLIFAFLYTASASADQVSFQELLDRSTATPDTIVRYGEADSQFIELYLSPSMSNQAPPLVAFIHGGCWLNSYGVNHTRGLAESIRNAGFSVALIEYRRLDDEGGGWPGTLNDIERAIASLAANKNSGYNSENITLMGHSAGGHLALLASQPSRELLINAVIGLAAITDIESYAEGESGCEQSAARFLATAPAEAQAMNPARQTLHTNITLLQGDADTIVGREQTELAGAKVIHIAEAGHFDLVHPDTHAFKRVLAVLKRIHSEPAPLTYSN